MGDACLVKIHEGPYHFTTLVTDFDARVELGLEETYVGSQIVVARESLRFIDRHEAHAELKLFDPESFNVFADFEAFARGLCKRSL